MAIDKLILNGNKLLDNEKFEEAVAQFDLALKEYPNAFKALIGKATALQRLKKQDEAFEVLESAEKVAKNRANRTQLATVYFRFFTYYYSKSELQTAIKYLNAAKKYSYDATQIELWSTQLLRKANKLGLTDLDWDATHDSNSKASSAGLKASPSTFKGKGIKLDMLQQGNDKVIINVFIDKVPKDEKSVKVDFTKESVSIEYPTKNSSEFQYEIDPLFAEIDTEKSNFLVNESTIQLVLVKADDTISWTQIEKPGHEGADLISSKDKLNALDSNTEESPLSSPTATAPAPKPVSSIPSEEPKPSGFAYPSSARNARDWSKFEVDDDEEEEPKGEDAFFKQIYSQADDDTKRAMMKSYIESNGTALSTNWSEVSKKTVETAPPDGLEAKKW